MTTLEKAILERLLELEASVKSMRTSTVPTDLLPLFARLDELATQVESHSMLRHYLENKSYEKARLWLQGREAENAPGACGHD